jgi:hypothetical protein
MAAASGGKVEDIADRSQGFHRQQAEGFGDRPKG